MVEGKFMPQFPGYVLVVNGCSALIPPEDIKELASKLSGHTIMDRGDQIDFEKRFWWLFEQCATQIDRDKIVDQIVTHFNASAEFQKAIKQCNS